MRLLTAPLRLLVLAVSFATTAGSAATPPTGLLYFASYPQRDNPAPAMNPHLLGALFTIYWSDVEKQPGVFDWSAIDKRIALWTDADKKVALRIMWSSSGNWPEPAAKHPTPQFVLDAGAVTVRSESSKTDVPLFWDPVYREHANRFLAGVARKFDGDPNVLFMDVTPGAETNPYRFRRINAAEPGFKTIFADKAASDGRKYSHELWLETVKQEIDDASAAFKQTPLLVTLNVGSLDGPEQFRAIGDHAVSRGCYVGQNGLNARSYNEDSPRKTAFSEWSAKTKFYFEMVDASGGGTGSLMDVMKAAERVGCNYLGVYAVDVLRGTRGQANFDPQYEAALAYGAKVMGQTTTTATAVPQTLAPARPQAAAQTGAQKKGPATAVRARDTEPSWLMPKVEGANLHYKTFDSKMAGQKVSYLLYLPPGYESSGEKRYPVVYWLHGIGGSQQGVPGMTARMTEAIHAGKMPPLIMVFVNGMIRSSWVDSADGKTPVESVAIKELIPNVDATYRTVATRAGRMIEGFSMGGGGAAKWGFKHPELFGAISIIDGALHKPGDPSAGRLADSFQTIYGGDQQFFEASNPWNLAEKNAGTVKGRTPVRIVTRTTGLGGLNQEFSELLTRLGVTNEFHAVPDAPHSPGPLYEGIGDKNWEFYRKAFAQASAVPGGGNSAPRAEAVEAKPAITPAPAPVSAAVTPQGFHLSGERWTYRDGEFAMSGILLKPAGKGPFPALLISHGLGGSAESFGLNKAREMVKWGFVCIAPDYTHSAKFMGGQRPGGGKGAPKGGAAKDATKSGRPAGRGGPAANPQYATYGASEENIRRAKTCIELLGKMPGVDAKRIAGYGHSMGGFVTIGLASAAPELLKAAAISGSGVAPQDGFPAPSAARAENVRTPFLILHGSVDPVVRPQQSADFKAILDKNQVPNQRTVYEGEGHPIDQSKREEVFAAILGWFTKHVVMKP